MRNLKGGKMVRIPYKLVGGILLISVTANGKNGFFFVSDTGASICLRGESFRGDPQITADPQTPNMVTVSSVRVGKNVYEKITAAISDIGAIKRKVPVEGVIGYQVLSPQRSILDFENHRLIMEKTRKISNHTEP